MDYTSEQVDAIEKKAFDAVMRKITTQVSKSPAVLGIVFEAKHSAQVSNTHSAPRRGVTNWGSKDHLPTGYPGFSGRVWLLLDDNNKEITHSNRYKITTAAGFHTGSGGYGDYDMNWGSDEFLLDHYGPSVRPYPLSWDVKIFDADFAEETAELTAAIEQYNSEADMRKAIDKLSGTYHGNIKYLHESKKRYSYAWLSHEHRLETA